MNDPTPTRPTVQSERIEVLDVLRGFTIFGIFVVNAEIMNCVFINGDAFGARWTRQIDVITGKLKVLFFYSKLFPIFFYRMMCMLFLVGVAHILYL